MQDTSLFGQCGQQWKLRITTQEVAPAEVANSKLRRLLVFNETASCTDGEIGHVEIEIEASNREGAPRWRGPAKIPEIDDTGVTVELQSRTSKIEDIA